MFGNNVYFSSILKLVGDKKFTLNILALSEKYVLSIKFLYVMVCIFFDMTSNVLFLFFISTLSSRFIRISLNISLLSLSRQFTIHLNSSSRLNMLCENGFNAICRISTYKNLHKIALKNGGKVKILKKHGLPFFLAPLNERTGFILGAVLFAFILSFLSSFIWNVEIKGCDTLSEATISTYLENHKFKSGVMWSAVDRKSIAWDMMSDFDDIAWVHINRKGTTAVVEINETRKEIDEIDEYNLKGIKAIRKEISVTAQRQQSKLSIRQTKNYYTLRFFSLDIPLYFKIKKGDFEKTSDKYLKIKGKALPIGYTITSEQAISAVKYDLTNDEMVNLARKKLSIEAERELDGYEIVNADTKYQIKNDQCVMTGYYIVRYADD